MVSGVFQELNRIIAGITTAVLFAFSVVAFANLVFTNPAFADQGQDGHTHAFTDSHKQNVEHLLEMMGLPAQVDKSAAEVMKIYSAKITDDSVGDDIKKLVSAYQTDLQKMVAGVLSWNAIKSNYINVYASNLAESDVAGAKQFIESPAGKKFFSGQSAASGEIQQITTRLVESDLVKPMKELRKSLHEGISSLQPK